MGEVEGFAVGFQEAAGALVLLQGDAGDVGTELVGGAVVVQRDLQGGGHACVGVSSGGIGERRKEMDY